MSIWHSLDPELVLTTRDNYTGAPITDPHGGLMHVDVATATSYHDCVRFTIGGSQVMLDPHELSTLILLLTNAREIIDRATA